MLPIAAHGRTKRGGIPVSYLYTTITVLGVLVCFFGSSLWHTRSTLDSHADEVYQLTRKLRSMESQEKQHRNVASQLEMRNRQLEGSLADATSDLRLRDVEVTTLEEQKMQAETTWRNKVMDLEARLEFEKTVVQTLNANIAQMESAHSAREADWHELSARWMQFEKELTSDNERMLAELAQHEETRTAAQSGGFAHAHTMPQQEPLYRDEAEFKPRTQLPPEDEFLARQRQLLKEQDRLRREQEQLVAEREAARTGNVIGRHNLGGSMGMGRRAGGDFEGGGYGIRNGGAGQASSGESNLPLHETQHEQGYKYHDHQRWHGHHDMDGEAPDIGHPHHDDHYDPAEHAAYHHDDWAYGDDHWDGAHGHWDDDYHPDSWDWDDDYHGDWDHHGWDRYDEDYGDHLDPLDQAWIGDSLEGGEGEGGHWPGSHPHAGDGGDYPHHNLHHHRRFHHGHPDLPLEEQHLQGGATAAGADVPLGSGDGQNGGSMGGSSVEGGDGGLPVLGREVPSPVLGKEELPVLGKEETPPVLGREEIPVLGRDPQRSAGPVGEDPAAQGSGERGGGAPSRWQRMQEAAMPGRFRHWR